MKNIDPLGMPWDEYVVMHFREIAAALLLVVILLCALPFVELPGATTLTGRVTSQGKPVVFGTVTVITSDQRAHSVPIQPDGTYALKGVPRGPVKVAVSSPNPTGRPLRRKRLEATPSRNRLGRSRPVVVPCPANRQPVRGK